MHLENEKKVLTIIKNCILLKKYIKYLFKFDILKESIKLFDVSPSGPLLQSPFAVLQSSHFSDSALNPSSDQKNRPVLV